MNKRIKTTIFLLICIIIILICNNYSLAADFATTVGTKEYITYEGEKEVRTNTTDLTYNAANYYEEMGYLNTKRLADPSYLTLVGNLSAKVQLFCTHGSVDSITFASQVGISTGNTHTSSGGLWEFIGVNDVARSMWNNNTVLVTYIACNTAGLNGEFSYDSLTYKTVSEGGSRLALGFGDEVPYSMGERWSERFHSKLKAGAGVWDSMDYANSDPYFNLWAAIDNRDIRKCYLVRHDESVNDNMILNRYINSELNSIADTYSTDLRKDDNILKSKIEINKNEEDVIIDYLKQYDSEFDINNYSIGRSSMYSLCASKKEDVKQIDYIYVTLKIGEFYTDAGYVAKIKDDKIVAIYDNNINVEKQKNALANKEKFSINTNSVNTKDVKERALANSKLENVSANEDVKYYYDIKNDKKYLIVPIKSEIDDVMGGKDVFIDTVQYEI